jgi:hypothetical protein
MGRVSPPKISPRKRKACLPWTNFKVQKLYSCKSQQSDERYRNFSTAIAYIDSYRNTDSYERSVNFEMSFWCLQFFQNNEQKQFDLR